MPAASHLHQQPDAHVNSEREKRHMVAVASYQAPRGEDAPSPPVSCYAKHTVLIFKGLSMLPVRAALPGQEWRLEGDSHVQQPPPFILLPFFTGPAKYHCSLPQPLKWQQCRQHAAGLAGFPPVVAVLPPVVLVASHPSCNPGKAQYLSHIKMLRSTMKFLLPAHF